MLRSLPPVELKSDKSAVVVVRESVGSATTVTTTLWSGPATWSNVDRELFAPNPASTVSGFVWVDGGLATVRKKIDFLSHGSHGRNFRTEGCTRTLNLPPGSKSNFFRRSDRRLSVRWICSYKTERGARGDRRNEYA